jgi:hypothetical protein
MRKFFLLIGLISLTVAVYSQEPAAQQTIEDLLESLGENLSDDADIQEVLDDLERFGQDPLQINKATRDELLRLHLLSDFQIDGLISFREKTGAIYSIYELASIDGFTPDILQKIEPFVSFGVENILPDRVGAFNHLLVRTGRSFPSSQSGYEGSPERYYLRMKHESANFQYGFVMEKDPGEAFFSQSNKHGFDYTSAYANMKIGKNENRLYAGDYHVRFGQGLVAWQGFSMGKSIETTNVLRSGQGIKSYASTDENQFFRGIAAHFKFGQIVLHPFVSYHKVDANIDTLSEIPSFGAFQTSGYHRTGSEISGENALGKLTAGGNVSFSHGQWSVGLTSVYNRFDVTMNRSDDPYNQFLPEGQDHLVTGLDWKGSVRKVFFFGEAALGKNAGKALLVGAMMKPASNTELSLIYRNINKTYFSFYSSAFTESSRVNDEHGLYLGLKVFPAAKWSMQGYIDFFKFQWIKYTTAAPSSGVEFLTQISYTPSVNTSFYLRFFQEEKGQRLITDVVRYNEQQVIDRLRFNFSHNLNEEFSLKSRVELSFYTKQNKEKGYLFSQDLNYKPINKSCAINGRLAYFFTDSYNTRLYAFENDLLYSFSVPAMFGDGLRAYLNFQKRFGPHFTCWLKLATTHQFSGSSAENATDSSTKSEIKFQIRYQY